MNTVTSREATKEAIRAFRAYEASSVPAYATGNYRQIDLAMQFGSTQSGISQIVLNTAWRNEEGGAQ